MGPKTSLFLQLVVAAGVGGGAGFYIQHKLWSREKEERILELENKIQEKKERIKQLRSSKTHD